VRQYLVVENIVKIIFEKLCWRSYANQSMCSGIPIPDFFSFKKKKINKTRLIKLTWLGYLQSKLASPGLLGPVDFR
jgi:hypothetical protein